MLFNKFIDETLDIKFKLSEIVFYNIRIECFDFPHNRPRFFDTTSSISGNKRSYIFIRHAIGRIVNYFIIVFTIRLRNKGTFFFAEQYYMLHFITF